jgi:hypothetical protein
VTNLQRSSALSLLAGGLVGTALFLPAAALAQPLYEVIPVQVQTMERQVVGYRRVPVYGQVPVVRTEYVQSPVYQANQQPAYQQTAYQQPVYAQPYRQAYAPPVTVVDAQQREKSCQIGRLVGGLVGGGVGYAASRQDGRAWAVPLGALLGTQVGCNTAVGKGPTLW